MKRVILFIFPLLFGGCWTLISEDYMAQCQKTCSPNKVDRVSEYVCECQGDNESSHSDSDYDEQHGEPDYDEHYYR